MNNNYIKNFYNEICQNIGENYKIVLEPGRGINEQWIETDSVKWEIEEPLKSFVDELLLNTSLKLEEKIIKVYEYICLHYVYDVNVLYFFKTDNSDPDDIKYIAVDWYGRIIGDDWINNRKKHNRRICYEFSRMFAKIINVLIAGQHELEAVIVGEKDNTHYVVGLTGKDYSIILDQDDFNNIKDLTRVKLGLTINGIRIIRDETNKFKDVLSDYNKDKPIELAGIEEAKKNKDNGIINYFNTAINILNQYNLDSQGFFEYMRKIIEECDICTEKIWKEDQKNIEKRYERCLYFEFNEKTYLLDSITKDLRIIDLDKIDRNIYIFNPENNTYTYYGG